MQQTPSEAPGTICCEESLDISLFLTIIVLPLKVDYQTWIKTMQNRLFSKMDLKKISEISSLALMLPSSIIVGLFFGYVLDKVFGTHPWMLIAFFLLGIVSGFYSLFKALKKYKD